jgi:hypothetical protein
MRDVLDFLSNFILAVVVRLTLNAVHKFSLHSLVSKAILRTHEISQIEYRVELRISYSSFKMLYVR